MITQSELKKRIRELNNGLDGISDELTAAIEKYQRQYERELRRVEFEIENGRLKSTAINYSSAQSINMVQRLKFSGIVKSLTDKYNTIAELTRNYHSELGIEVDSFNYRDLRILNAVKQRDEESLLTEGITLDNLVKKELVNAVALNARYDTTISNLADNLLGSGDEKLGRLARYSKTYMNTSMMGLSRMVDKEIYDSLDLKDEYLYAGTVDKKIRDFCVARVGKIFTQAQIDEFPALNGSGLDPHFSPGGWNCRHRLINTELI